MIEALDIRVDIPVCEGVFRRPVTFQQGVDLEAVQP
jgi:hypothetical protein